MSAQDRRVRVAHDPTLTSEELGIGQRTEVRTFSTQFGRLHLVPLDVGSVRLAQNALYGSENALGVLGLRIIGMRYVGGSFDLAEIRSVHQLGAGARHPCTERSGIREIQVDVSVDHSLDVDEILTELVDVEGAELDQCLLPFALGRRTADHAPHQRCCDACGNFTDVGPRVDRPPFAEGGVHDPPSCDIDHCILLAVTQLSHI
ncbi:hypothetical protein [Rhodococcus rhodochrous]|uniref:hypothetical protein n=1 Tax=Rhodococcus rhodochrous TaxID=1829 RepID=UPI001EE6C084|nr:hypothetical protein [Rhodococcus rhodochrous]